MFRNQADWVGKYEKLDALWMHDDNMRRPHAELTTGNHSSGFFNSKPVIADEVLLREAACDLLEGFVQQGGDLNQIDGVVGPQTGATRLAQSLAERVTELTGHPCFWVSPKKVIEGREKSMVLTDHDRELLAGKSVLVCDDVVTTVNSVELAAKASSEAGAAVLPFILALVNRSGFEKTHGRLITSLISRYLPMWERDCPLCRQGSAAVRPKEGHNWKLLTADY